MSLERKTFADVDLNDPFFESLKDDYPHFEDWFRNKSAQSAYAFYNEKGLLDGFLYLKLEEGPLADISPAAEAVRRLKIGTFKVNPHGTRLGERFIKKIFDNAISERVRQIYVTIFPKHTALRALLETYGFEKRAEKSSENGVEDVFFRDFPGGLASVLGIYPAIRLRNRKAFLLALYPKWHTRLLPDSKLHSEGPDLIQDVSHTNSIHKVYLCAMPETSNLLTGDVLVIYRTSDNRAPAHYRSVATSICVVEEYRALGSFMSLTDFLTYCAPYSVFTDAELTGFWRTKRYPHIIRFTYNVALNKRVTRKSLIEELHLDGDARWGFLRLTHEQVVDITRLGLVDEDLVIN